MSYITQFFGMIFDWLNANITHNYGLTIILFTILFRLLLSPFDIRSRVGQREYTAKMKKIQPEIDNINKAYKNDPQKAQQRMMEVRKREGIGMMPKGCGTMLLTYPILIAFFAVFRNLAAEHMYELSTLTEEAQISQWFGENGFLWIKNIWQPDVFFNFSETWGFRTLPIIKGINGYIIPNDVSTLQATLKSAFDSGMLGDNSMGIQAFAENVSLGLQSARDFIGSNLGNGFYIFPILAGVTQILSLKFTGTEQTQPAMPDGTKQPGTGKFMKIFFPILFVYFCLISSSALAIYWVTSSLCMIVLNLIINKVLDAKEAKKAVEAAN